MINTKFVFGVSMVAIMAVGVAHADIAATTYFKGSGPITVNNGTISVAVDSSLSSSSTNPVQNKAVNTALSGKLANTSTIKNAIVTTDANGAVAPVEIVDSGTGTYVTDVAVSAGKVTLSRGTPSINNATLTIQKNGTSVGTFTANASEAKTVNIEVPTGGLASKDTISNTDVADDAAIAQSKISGLTTALSGKQATISDLATIRSGAEAGATAVQDLDDLGVTATATELNYVDGVTSNIQTQLNAKEYWENKVTSMSSNSTDTQYPSAKAVYNALNTKEATANKLTSTATTTVSDSNKDILYPSYAKVINMIGEQVDGRLGALSEGNTNLNTRLDNLNTNITALEEDKVNIAQGAKDKAVITNSSGNITTGTIGTGMITDGAVTSVKIADGTVALADLASNSVNSAKIVDASVEAADLASNSVTTAKITDLNVTTAKIAASAVTTAKIADSAVTAAKTSGVIGQIPSGSATSATYASIWVE